MRLIVRAARLKLDRDRNHVLKNPNPGILVRISPTVDGVIGGEVSLRNCLDHRCRAVGTVPPDTGSGRILEQVIRQQINPLAHFPVSRIACYPAINTQNIVVRLRAARVTPAPDTDTACCIKRYGRSRDVISKVCRIHG